jgi:hypothetical protein
MKKNTNEKTQYRQGDVLLVRIKSAIPDSTPIKPENGRLILAHGEVTGHHHSVCDEDAELIREGERMLLNVTRQTSLLHQEHTAIDLAPGLYEIRRQREYSPNALRNVAD